MHLTPERLAALDHLLALDSTRRRSLYAELDRFRALIMPRPDAFRRELLGLADERRSRLSERDAWALTVLTTDPDYLSPLGFIRQETANTRFLAWVLGDGRKSGLGQAPAQAVWSLLHARWRSAEASVQEANAVLSQPYTAHASARAEVDLGGPGRIDILWEVPDGRVLIEGKVDATPSAADSERYRAWQKSEGRPQHSHTQLERYRQWLGVSKGGQALVLLDLASRAETESVGPASGAGGGGAGGHRTGLEASRALAVTWREVLNVLIPASAGSTGSHSALRAWLKSVAIMENLSPQGSWADWTAPQRLEVLDNVTLLMSER